MALTLKGREQYGQLFFLDNTIESTSGDIDIQIGLTESTADLKLNRNIVLAPDKTFGLVDTVTGDIARLSVVDGVLDIDGANQLQVGQLKFIDNTIESITGSIDIEIGLTSSSANVRINRDLKITSGKSITFGDNTVQTTAFVASSTQSLQRSPTDPSTTGSLTGVMMGLSASITPVVSGKILIIISGDMDNSTGDNGAQVQIRTGTGSIPTNGISLTGNAQGGLVKMEAVVSGGATVVTRVPFSLNAIQTGLTLNTPYWIDLSLAAITGGTARVRDVSISVVEL